MKSSKIHGGCTNFLRKLFQQKRCQLGLKGTKIIGDKMRLLPSPDSLAGSRLIKVLGCKQEPPFAEKEGRFRGWNQEPRRWIHEPGRIIPRP